MFREKRVRDIMRDPSLMELSPDNTIKELVAAFVQASKDGKADTMLLVKERDTIIGIVSWTDLLDLLEPPYTKGAIKMEIFWEGLFTDRWRGIAKRKVKELMQPPVVVGPDDTLMKVSHTLNEREVETALVVEQGQLVGIVSISDLFSELLQQPA